MEDRPRTLAEELEALRPPLDPPKPEPKPAAPKPKPKPEPPPAPPEPEPTAPAPRRVRRRVVAIGTTNALLLLTVVAVMTWPAKPDPEKMRAEQAAGEVVLGEPDARPEPTTTSTTAPPPWTTAAPDIPLDPAAVTEAPPEPVAAVPDGPTTTTSTAPPRPSTTATTAPRPTTTTTTLPPRPTTMSPVSSTEVFSALRLTLSADPAAQARTAEFALVAEFGDYRVPRAVRLDYGDGAVVDGSVQQWGCGDPSAPNPYVFGRPAHTFPGPGTYTVTATVRTAPCAPGGGELPEDTAQIRVVVTVP